MARKYKAVLSLLLIVLAIVSVVMVTGVADINRIAREREEEKNKVKETLYSDVFRSDTSAALRLMKTDIENVFYTMTPEGDVSFYRLGGGKIEKLQETGEFDIEVTCSGQKIPAKVHYLEENGKTTGFGLFTNSNHPDVFLYDYMFFKVTDMFPSFASESKLILAADVDKNRFYSENKVYSEIFYLYPSGKTKYFLSENPRTVGLDAKLRTDYKMFTDDILKQDFKPVLFFSSRYYTALESENKTDILKSGGSGLNVDNLQYITDIASLNFWRSEDGVLYFANTESGFELRKFGGESDTAEIVKEFDGKLTEDYIISGSFLLSKKSGDIYSITNGKEYKIDYGRFAASFTPDLFTVSNNGKYCLIRGANSFKKPSLGVMNLETGELNTYKDDVFGFVGSMHILDDGMIDISVASGESAASYYQLIGTVGKKLEKSENTTAQGNAAP